MNKRLKYSPILMILAGVIIFLGLWGMSITSDILLVVFFQSSLIVSVMAVVIGLANEVISILREPYQHSVAIIGFPKAGKTTLLTVLFSEIDAGYVPGVNATLRGKKTIEKVNEDYAKLKRGMALGPTKDQDLWIYRTFVSVNNFLSPVSIRVDFADFSGDESENFTTQSTKWLHENDFFRWVIDAHAYVFVIDLGHYLRNDYKSEYVALMSTRIRAAWQVLKEHYADAGGEFIYHPLVLLFTKADLFDIRKNRSAGRITQKIKSAGFEKIPTEHVVVSKEAFDAGVDEAKKDFSELIQYLRGESRRFNVVFTSSFGTLDKKRIGMDELIKSVLPSSLSHLNVRIEV